MRQLELIPAYGHQEEIVTLFTEYTNMLMEQDETVRQYLILQNYEKELEHPEEKYGMPEGRLYLACWEGRPAGCIGLRKLDEERGELKRLYVRPEFRGRRMGEALIRRILDDAREIGYRHVLFWTRCPFCIPPSACTGRWGFMRSAATTKARWKPPSSCNTIYKEIFNGYYTGLYGIPL